MQRKIHLITFYTNKFPALDLSLEENTLRDKIGIFFDSYTAYNPDTIDSKFTKQYYNLNEREHSRGCFHGFWAWKPHIILKKILDPQINQDDIVVYTDCNISRYKERIEDYLSLRNITEKLFSVINCDFLISKDHNKLKIKHHVKPETLKAIIGKGYSRYLSCPLLHANRVFVRKSDLSIKILQKWENLCLDEKLLLPTLPEQAPLRWHTHDQAIITSLCQKLVIDNILPHDWPGFCYNYNIAIPSKRLIFNTIKNNRLYYNG